MEAACACEMLASVYSTTVGGAQVEHGTRVLEARWKGKEGDIFL